MNLKPYNQTNLYGLVNYLDIFISLYKKEKLPNKILLSGLKGIGKSTLAYHLINFVLTQKEEFSYDNQKYQINENNKDFRLIQNGSNTNFRLIDILPEKKNIDINQIRDLINLTNKSSFNDKPRFILFDNIEFLNINSINALLKTLEEPSENTYFILINNQKKILPTLKSRCLEYKISLTNSESLLILQNLLDDKPFNIINKRLMNYYFTPGNIYKLIEFSNINKINLIDINLKDLLSTLINDQYYKNEPSIKFIIYDLIEFFLRSYASSNSSYLYSYFINKINNMRKFNLDEESFFIEFRSLALNE